MVVEAIRCPHCQSEAVVKYGTTSNGKERFRCQRGEQCGRTFIRAYAYPGRTPEVKQQIIEMTLNGSGVRDIARVLHVSPSTVIGELRRILEKKAPLYQSGAAGWMRISHLGNSGWRFSRFSTARMALLLRVMPREYSL